MIARKYSAWKSVFRKLGSYNDKFSAGTFGKEINKNIEDCYRFIVQN
jgi:hypothetical protein